MNIDEAKKNIEVAKRWLNGSSGELDTAKAIEFGITRTMVEIAEQAIGEVSNLRTQLIMSERISADRNEARVAGLVELEKLRVELSATKRELTESRSNESAWKKATETSGPRFAQDKIVDLLSERSSLRAKLETQTKLATGLQEAVDRLTREQVERMKAFRDGKLAKRMLYTFLLAWSEYGTDRNITEVRDEERVRAGVCAILSDLAQMPVELPSHNEMMSAYWDTEVARKTPSNGSIRLMTLLQTRLAPLLATRHATKIESTEQKPTTTAGVVAVCDGAKSTMQNLDEDSLHLAIRTARVVHDRADGPADGTAVILGSLISAVELLARRR